MAPASRSSMVTTPAVGQCSVFECLLVRQQLSIGHCVLAGLICKPSFALLVSLLSFCVILAAALVQLSASKHSETQRLALQTIELLALENSSYILTEVHTAPYSPTMLVHINVVPCRGLFSHLYWPFQRTALTQSCGCWQLRFSCTLQRTQKYDVVYAFMGVICSVVVV